MKTLKNRKIAIVICVCAVIAATLFGVHKSLGKLARDIENTFYNGVYLEKEGYTQVSIESQLKKMAEAALGAVTITKNYPGMEQETENLRAARQEMLSAETIRDKHTAYTSVQKAFMLLYDSGRNSSQIYSERDAEALSSYAAAFSGASAVIAKSNYNEAVDRFNNGQSYSYLAYTLKPLAFVRPPQSFG